jgi:hypothetical protein
LVSLRYGNSQSDAMRELGPSSEIRNLFLNFQPFLYRPEA